MAREAFFEDLTDLISTFKIRGSWGELGNQKDLLRQKSDELSDLRFHQEELFAAWEAAMEEQEHYEQSQTEE